MLAVIDVKPGLAEELHLLNQITLVSVCVIMIRWSISKPTRTIYAQVAKTAKYFSHSNSELHKGFYAWTKPSIAAKTLSQTTLRRYLFGWQFQMH